jgi:hypothetical protein
LLTTRILEIERANQPEPSVFDLEARDAAAGSQSPFSPRIPVYRTLVSADTYRDGDSLEARFACAEGSFEMVWLPAALDPQFGVRYVHTDLAIHADANRQEPARTIAKNPFEEEAVVIAMLRFLRNPSVAVPFSHRTPDEHYWGRSRRCSPVFPIAFPSKKEAGREIAEPVNRVLDRRLHVRSREFPLEPPVRRRYHL